MRPDLDDTQAAPPSDPARTATLAGGARAEGAELAEGLRLDHFRIEKKVGAGGMGEVYLATDLALDRPVAIKVLAAGVARDRLVREARAQARIQHPNVGHIYFIGEDAGRLYFAMEYIAGKTLAENVADGPMPVGEALAAVRAAALGLREAQRAGITHRDVKPSNLMVDGNGHVKVLDFGLAAGEAARAGDGPVAQTTLAGTPLYMAPEQARGEPIDCRADIYALGATLYHLVSGRPPFQADSVEKLVTMHASAERPAVPRGKSPRTQIAAVDALIARMMAPRAKDRFANYDELLRAIEATSIEHTRPGGFWVRCAASMVDLFVILMLIGGVTLLAQLAKITLTERGLTVTDDAVVPVAFVFVVVLLGRWRATAGKALFELEVVDYASGSRATWRQIIARELIQLGPLVAVSVIVHSARALGAPAWVADVVNALGSVYSAFIVLALLHAALRVPGKRTPWDRVAGTMVRYRTAATMK